MADKYSSEITNEFVKFGEKPTDGSDDDSQYVTEVSGVLISIASIDFEGKPVGKYKMTNQETGITKAFLGSAVLDDLLESPDVEIGGDYKIVFTGTKPTDGAGKSPTKQFKLFKA